MTESQDVPAEESVYDTARSSPFQPFEPEPVQPNPSPAPSIEDPGTVGGTSGEDGETGPESEPQAEPQENLPEFDPRYREAFTGLLYLGRLQKSFTYWGHQFVVKTLTTEELAEIALLVKPYEGTRVANAVFNAATVAAGVVTLDGRSLPQPLGGMESGLAAKFEYVMRNWMPPVREKVFDEIYALETMSRAVLDAMGKVSG